MRKAVKKGINNIPRHILVKESGTLVRKHRKSVCFNEREIQAINEYCRKYRVSSMAAFFRKTIMDKVFEQMNESYPKLF